MGQVSIFKGNTNEKMGGLLAGPGFDFYYEAFVEQRFKLHNIVQLSDEWYWNRAENLVYRSYEFQGEVSDMRTDNVKGWDLGPPMTALEGFLLDFCRWH